MTRRDRTPVRESGGRAPIPSPSSAPATSPESDGDDVAANAAPDVGVGESDGSPTAPSDHPLLGGPPRSRNAVPDRRRDVAPADIPHAGGTIVFWLQPAWDGESREDASFVRLGDDRMRIYKSDHYLRFEITDTEGHPTSLGMPITNWTPNDWHQVATTWDGHVISFFVDGALIGQNAYEGQIDLPRDPKLFVGTNGAEGSVAPGRLAGVQVGNQPLTADAVSRRFALSRPAEQR